jgi:Ion channel
MTQSHQVAILLPLIVGATAVAGTILIRALAVTATINFFRRQQRLGRAGAGFWIDLSTVALAVSIAFIAHLIEIGVWAFLLVVCGEFSELALSYYHSAGNYTTLGSGDLVMTSAWRMLGPLEAANGMLMFGVSTAIIFAVIQRLVQTRFSDLRD